MQNNNIKTISQELLEKCRKLIGKKFDKNHIAKIESNDNFIKALIKGKNFNIFYNMLEDNISKSFFKKAVIYRYMLSFYPNVHLNFKKELIFGLKYGTISEYSWITNMIIFLISKRIFFPKEVGAFALFHIFSQKQYDVKNIFEVKDDATIFDIGAWKGDTAYFFSKKCSANAKIYAFEPDNYAYETLEKVKNKYKLNNVITKNILFSNAKKEIDFVSMIKNTPAVKKNAITIDKFVEENNIEKIDYIKIDVEGEEKNILAGALKTIKKFKPHLAIAIYHGGKLFMEDFYDTPIFIKNIINEDYEYYIRTFTPWCGETILYCKPTCKPKN